MLGLENIRLMLLWWLGNVVSPAAVGELHVLHVDVADVLVERDAGRAVALRQQRHHPRRAAQRPLHVPRKQDGGRRQDRHRGNQREYPSTDNILFRILDVVDIESR